MRKALVEADAGLGPVWPEMWRMDPAGLNTRRYSVMMGSRYSPRAPVPAGLPHSVVPTQESPIRSLE